MNIANLLVLLTAILGMYQNPSVASNPALKAQVDILAGQTIAIATQMLALPPDTQLGQPASTTPVEALIPLLAAPAPETAPTISVIPLDLIPISGPLGVSAPTLTLTFTGAECLAYSHPIGNDVIYDSIHLSYKENGNPIAGVPIQLTADDGGVFNAGDTITRKETANSDGTNFKIYYRPIASGTRVITATANGITATTNTCGQQTP